MAMTSIATGDEVTKKLWDEKLFRETRVNTFFSKFTGTDKNSIIQEKTELEKGKGDRIRFTMIEDIDEDGGQTGEGQTLEGNETSLSENTFDLTLGVLRHGIRDDGGMTRQRAIYDVDGETAGAMQVYLSKKMDKLNFTALETSPTKIIYGGDATSTADIEVADKLTPALISKMKYYAQSGGGGTVNPLRPVMVDGKETYVLVVSEGAAYDLTQNSVWTAAQQYSMARGKDNPLFTGAIGMWDGVVIHSHRYVGSSAVWGSGGNIAGAKCSLLGAQSLLWGWGQRPKTVMKTFDYDWQHGLGMSMIYKVAKPQFSINGGSDTDYGSLGLYVAHTDLSAL